MDTELTKAFPFSASYRSGPRAVGRNFKLWITTGALSEEREKEFEAVVDRELISKVHTRDLSQGVEFLKGVGASDAEFLRAFWGVLSEPLKAFTPKRLALERDSKTVTTLLL